MTTKYYQQELANLRELAAEFAAANPAIAPHLGGPRPDPDVERILEGVAFLTGQIRNTLDEGFPEFAQGILNQIFPHYLRPIPSATIIQFTPKNMLNSEKKVPKGTYIDSIPIEGVNCRFRTCSDVEVSPLKLERVSAEVGSGGRRSIELQFELQLITTREWTADKIRLLIGGDYSGAADLYFLLMRFVDSVEVSADGAKGGHLLPEDAVRPVGFDKDEALFAYPSNAFPAYRLLQEYFLLKEKFLFFELRGLSSWQARGSTRRFSIRINLKKVPFELPRLGVERFILHAAPAINLFQADAEPLLLDNKRNELRVRPARDSGGKVRVYSVDTVTGRTRGATKNTAYVPLGTRFGSGSETPVYQVTFKPTQGGLVEPHLIVSYPEGYSIPAQETLTIRLTCTNGDLPVALRPGEICKPTSSTSELVEFKNLLPPTEHQEPPSGGAMLWRLLSHLSLNYLSVADSENLQALLGLYIFSGGDKKNELANRRRVAGISNVQVRPADRLVRGALMRGQEIEITIERENFSSRGDVFVFGGVLERLFASFASLNVYTALSIKDATTGEYDEWPASLGARPLM